MRLFLLPISTRRALLYAKRSTPPAVAPPAPSSTGTAPSPEPPPPPAPPMMDRVSELAAKRWVAWEQSDKKWQRRLTEYGNRALQRIAFEEWGLKSVGPLAAARREEILASKTPADRPMTKVLFPGSIIREDKVLGMLRRLSTERQALHSSRMWWSFVGMPISAPFMVVPLIPNIPFFYLCYRAWSHWRALSGSKHIEFLLDNDCIRSLNSTQLDTIYPATNPSREFITGPANDDSVVSEEMMILTRADGKRIADELQVPELTPEIERAVKQVEDTLNKSEEPEQVAKTFNASTQSDEKEDKR